MRVKFHLQAGYTVSLLALDKKGRETDDKGHAIRRLREIYGDEVRFTLDEDVQKLKQRELDIAIRKAEEAEAEYQRPQMMAA